MALIGKIREKSILLLILIGGALLAFVLGDLFRSGRMFFQEKDIIGEINGTIIKPQEFEKLVNENIQNYELNTGEIANGEIIDMIREQSWNEIVNKYTIEKEIAKLGLSVTPEELFDMIQGKDPNPQIKKAFTNPETGVFNPQDVINFLKNLDNDQTGKTRARWLLFEQALKKERLYNKYLTLIKKGFYVNSVEKKFAYKEKNQKIDFDYVAQRYSTIPDSLINITDDEIEKYYNKHKLEYSEEEAYRKIEYVVFDVIPTQEDTNQILKWFDKIKNDFKNSDNDSLFVVQYSDLPFDDKYYAKGELEHNLDSAFFSNKPDTIIGPYIENGYFKLAKLSKINFLPDSVKARHILIKIDKNKSIKKAKALADSLKQILKEKKASFEELVKKYSEDLGSAQNGGDLGWFKDGTMVKPFNNACFFGKKGDLKIVNTQFGIHLLEILDQSPKKKKINVAIVARKIEASESTFDDIFNIANKFALKNNTSELFNDAVNKEGLTKRVADKLKPNDKNLPGIKDARPVIKWAFKAEKNDVSEPFEVGNKIIVALLTDIIGKGPVPLEKVKSIIEIEVKKEHKAKQLTEKMKGFNNLDDLASSLHTIVQTANSVTFDMFYIPGIGNEPKLQAYAFTLDKGQMSIPINGKSGVYVIQIDNIYPLDSAYDYSFIAKQIESQYASQADMQTFEALKKNMEIIDKRYLFY